MFIPDPDFYPSRISDPGSNNSTKREGENIEQVKKICSPQNTTGKYYSTFHPKILALRYQNMGLGFGIRDPGSEKKYSGSRIQGQKAPDPGSVTLLLLSLSFFCTFACSSRYGVNALKIT